MEIYEKDGYLRIEGIENGAHILSNERYMEMQKKIDSLERQVSSLRNAYQALGTETKDIYMRGVTAGYLRLKHPERKN